MESMDTSMDSREVAGIQVRMELQRGRYFGKYGIAEVSGMQSNHLPVDIPSVKGKWSYRYVSELPLLADDGNTSSRHSKLSYIASGQPISLSCRQTVPEVFSGKQRHSQAVGLCQFGLAYHNVARHHGAVVIQTKSIYRVTAKMNELNCIVCVIGHAVTAKVYHQSPVDANQPVATLKATWLSLNQKFSPRRRLRLCPRANKNLHIPSGNLAPGVASGYAPGQIKICIFPQGYAPGYASGNFSKFSKFLEI
ncbi:hypothetical protein T09_12482 [Trichinella sp. T9]|nr:hypothetical protein T09_12482 [Trichinella sp. T9]